MKKPGARAGTLAGLKENHLAEHHDDATGLASQGQDAAPGRQRPYIIVFLDELSDTTRSSDQKVAHWSVRAKSDWTTGEFRGTDDELAKQGGMAHRTMQRHLGSLAKLENSPIRIDRDGRNSRTIVDLSPPLAPGAAPGGRRKRREGGAPGTARGRAGSGAGERRKRREVAPEAARINVDASNATLEPDKDLERIAAAPSYSSQDLSQDQLQMPGGGVVDREGSGLGRSDSRGGEETPRPARPPGSLPDPAGAEAAGDDGGHGQAGGEPEVVQDLPEGVAVAIEESMGLDLAYDARACAAGLFADAGGRWDLVVMAAKKLGPSVRTGGLRSPIGLLRTKVRQYAKNPPPERKAHERKYFRAGDVDWAPEGAIPPDQVARNWRETKRRIMAEGLGMATGTA